MKYLSVLLLFVFFFFISCNKDEENHVEEFIITNYFYEYFPARDDTGLLSDSLYFIDSEEKLKQITSNIPSIYDKIKTTDFNNNTILITASRDDYNIHSSEIKMTFDTLSKTCNLIFSFVLGEPPVLEKTYFRVWVCVIPKMPIEPKKSYTHVNISGS